MNETQIPGPRMVRLPKRYFFGIRVHPVLMILAALGLVVIAVLICLYFGGGRLSGTRTLPFAQ